MRRVTMRKIVLLILMLVAGTALADTVYVNDLLRVGVRSEAASNESPLTVVTTGTALDVLERQGDYVKVRTPDGTEGWVNNVYVTGEQPARLRIKALRSEYTKLQQELDNLRASTTDLMEEKKRFRAQVSELKQENGALHGQLSKLYNESVEGPEDVRWMIYPAAMIGLFLLGIYLGVRWHRQRVAKRLGGLEL